MLKKLLPILSLIFVLLPITVKADTVTNCSPNIIGSGITCTTSEDVFQQLDDLKQQYGISAFTACFGNGYNDPMFSDPWYAKALVTQTKLCLENRVASQQQAQPSCGAGTAKYHGQCLGYDDFCQQYYGPNFQYWETDSAGKIGCECKTGFTLNQDGKSCVASTQQPKQTNCSMGQAYYNGQCMTPDQACQQKYGHSGWMFAANTTEQLDSGQITCSCSTGYVFNFSNTACVAPPSTSQTQKQPIVQPKVTKNPKQNNDKPGTVAPTTVNVQGNATSIQSDQPKVEIAQSIAPSQPAVTKQDKPSLFRRMLNWFKGLF
jgi:hypothetical protein